jgi:hypothetical protein
MTYQITVRKNSVTLGEQVVIITSKMIEKKSSAILCNNIL